VPENDSQGQFIFLAAELWRYTHDRALLQQMWPHVAGAVRYMEQQRQSERTRANLAPGRKHLYGLLPASISHAAPAGRPVPARAAGVAAAGSHGARHRLFARRSGTGRLRRHLDHHRAVAGRHAAAPAAMPHGWISSDYIRSALDLFAYEREFDRALVVGDGIPLAWRGRELRVRTLPATIHIDSPPNSKARP
jgi:hypothetical protein